jgi:galactokinase/galacturonokinase
MEQLQQAFKAKYAGTPTHMVKSPLRICPLGAHIDHQGGVVTGMALQESVDLAFSANDDGYIRVQSLDFPDEEYFHVDEVPGMILGFWGNYLRGAVLSLARDYKLRKGINGVIQGKIPIGGLSSSAAVTTAYLMGLCRANEITVSPLELIQYSHWVENEFIGLNNGILDQSSNILSQNGFLMYMDCATEGFELVPRSDTMPEFEIVIAYSGISTTLIKTDYNNRVDECKVAAWTLQELGNLEITPFKQVKQGDIPDDVYRAQRDELPGRFRRRADHYFSEVERVNLGVKAWENGEIQTFGKLMFESGESSIRNYECGCDELITIYETLKACEGVYGARFSGAGYRGACIGIIDPAFEESIKSRIDSVYPQKHPQFRDKYELFFSTTDDGARTIEL